LELKNTNSTTFWKKKVYLYNWFFSY